MSAWLWSAAFAFMGWLWENSWQASLIVLVILLVQKALGRWLVPEWRYALWALVAIRLLLPGVPESGASVYNVVPPPGEFAGSHLRTALGFQGDAGAMASGSDVATAKDAADSASPSLPTSAPGSGWQKWVALAWLAGAVWMLVRLAGATMHFRGAIRRTGGQPSNELRQLLEEAAATFRMEAPDAVQTAAVDSPAVTGLWRPLVVLPAGLEKRFSREEIHFLLLHELAHIRRGDLWTNLLCGILQALHWFNPVLWIAFRRARQDRETACDARVLATQDREGRSAYGHTLIKVLEDLQTASRPKAIIGILESRSQLRQRLLSIASYVKPTKLAAAGALLIVAVLAVTMLTRAAGKEKAGAAAKAASQALSYSDRLLAAARAGDGPLIQKVIADSYKGPPMGPDDAAQLLDSLVSKGELKAFKVLLAELRKTNLGKNWQPNDALLAGTVKDGRTDFLDVFLGARLDLARLRAQEKIAAAATSAWIGRRATETERERADIKKLVDAGAEGDLATMRQLLDAGVDVNGRTSDGDSWTPLTRAASANKVEAVRLLLERGAEVDLPKHPGWDYTPLCLTSSVEVADVLKASGANVHATLFKRPTSILTYVAMFNGAPMVQWFLDQGLDPKMLGDNDQTLLFGVKDAATAEILLKAGVDPNRPDEFGRVPLQEVRNGGVAKALIKGGAKVTGLKSPLLPSMVQMSSSDAVEAVLEASAPYDHATLQKALFSAAHMNKDKTAEVLLKYGAKANELTVWTDRGDKMYPLLMCCIHNAPETARVLIKHGADPNAGEKPGQMLKTAIHNGNKEVAEILKQAGARGVSDLAYALAMKDQKRTVELLNAAPAYQNQPEFWDGVLATAAERGDLPTVKAALQKGVPILVKSPKGAQDGYHSAAWEGQWEVLEFLLQQRDPKDDPDQLSNALSGAVWNCHPYEDQRPARDFEKCVELLLAAGAPVRTDGNKDSGLVTGAVFSRYPGGNSRVVKMLVDAGADPNPTVGKDKRLAEAIAEDWKRNGCSVPFEQVVLEVEKLANVTIDRGK